MKYTFGFLLIFLQLFPVAFGQQIKKTTQIPIFRPQEIPRYSQLNDPTLLSIDKLYPSNLKYHVEFDSINNKYQVGWKVGEHIFRIPSELSLSQFHQQLAEKREERILELACKCYPYRKVFKKKAYYHRKTTIFQLLEKC